MENTEFGSKEYTIKSLLHLLYNTILSNTVFIEHPMKGRGGGVGEWGHVMPVADSCWTGGRAQHNSGKPLSWIQNRKIKNVVG